MTSLVQMSSNQAGKEITANENLAAVSPAGLYARKYTTTTGLTWGYYGGAVMLPAGLTTINDGTLALTASATNYVEADPTSGAVAKNTTGWTAGKIPLYSVVTGTSTITSYSDKRLTNLAVPAYHEKSVAGGADITLTADESRARILQFTGTLSANINIILPAVGMWLISNQTSGAFTLTVKTAAGTGVLIGQGGKMIVYGDQINIQQLGGGAVNAVDVSITDAGNYFIATDVEAALQELASGALLSIPASGVVLHTAGTPTYVTQLDQAINHFWSAGGTHGFGLTDNGNGTVNVAGGEILLRISADQSAELISMSVAAASNLALTDLAVNYIYCDYNAGTPQILITTTTNDFNCLDKCLLWIISRNGLRLYSIFSSEQNTDFNRKHRRVLMEADPFRHVNGGSALSETGTRNLAIAAGAFYFALHRMDHAAFDTSVAGTDPANCFDLIYRNGSGGWTISADQKQIDNTHYDDGSGMLATLTSNRYNTHYVYLLFGTPNRLIVQMGQINEGALAGAIADPVPSPPSWFANVAVLIGRIVVLKSASTFADVSSAFEKIFNFAGATDHAALANLLGGADYYHLSTAQYQNLPATITAAGGALLDDADAAAQRATLGVQYTLIGISVFTASGTWTKPAGCVAARVCLVGGGAGAGGCPATSASTYACGGGGGSGGYGEDWITSGLGATEEVTIGSGGAGAVGGGSASNGGTTSFGAHISATGGSAGTSGAATASTVFVLAGTGGVATGGILNGDGANGALGVCQAGTMRGGAGGSSPFGGGGAFASGNAAGNNAGGYGSGGGGACSGLNQSARNGGDGSPGIVIVYEYG